MHTSALNAMRRCVADFVPADRPIRVVDLGSATNEERMEAGMTHGALFAEYDAEVIGLDIIEGPNVDRVLGKPYKLPLRSNSVDVVVSGQVFEHIPFFWASLLEIARILKPGGVFLMTVPSRGHKHMLVDCWRYYDDGVRAMGAFSGLVVREAHTDYPKRVKGPERIFEVETNADVEGYWGDTVGVLQKPTGYPTRRMAIVRGPVVWWANRTAGIFTDSVEAAEQRRLAEKERAQRERAAKAAKRARRAARRGSDPVGG